MSEGPKSRDTLRGGETMIAIGLFMVVMAVPVLFGTIYAENDRARIVNVVAGLVILAIGAGYILRGWIVRRRSS